jgi:hypothetical protein
VEGSRRLRQQLHRVGEISGPVRGRGTRDNTGGRADGGGQAEVRRDESDVGLHAQQSDSQQTRDHRRRDDHWSDAVPTVLAGRCTGPACGRAPAASRRGPPPDPTHGRPCLPCCRGRTRHGRPAGRAISRVRPATIGRDGRARRGERYDTRGRGGPALDGWLLRHGGQLLREPLPSALATEDPHVTLLDRERCLARDALRPARGSWCWVIFEAP